jgi:hypothetical protein
MIEKTFTIKTTPDVMRRIERFFALLHWNSRHGHSGLFAMPLDGDGADKVTVEPTPGHAPEVGLCGGIGGGVEIAGNDSYWVMSTKHLTSDYVVRPAAGLYKNGELLSASPSSLPSND